MSTYKISLSIILGLAVPTSRILALTDAEAAQGRVLAQRYEDTIVLVEAVATIEATVGGHLQAPHENRAVANGTLISPSGMVVTVLAAFDPHASMEAMMNSRGTGAPKVEIGETDFRSVKMRLADDTEIPAVVVLKDRDHNLMFIAPVSDTAAPRRTYPFVPLKKAATGIVLGNYYYVSRATISQQRVPLVRATTIIGIITQPHRIFLMSEEAVGIPVFDPSGLVLGISTVYLENGRQSGLMVLSGADVDELSMMAKQKAPEAN